MKVKNKIIKEIMSNQRLRLLLALEFGCGERNVIEHLNRNKNDGKLTTETAKRLIVKELKTEDIFE